MKAKYSLIVKNNYTGKQLSVPIRKDTILDGYEHLAFEIMLFKFRELIRKEMKKR